MTDASHEIFMNQALAEARTAFERGDGPVGCVVVHRGAVISRAGNRTVTEGCKLEHAEMVAIRRNAAYIHRHGPECVLYTTLEPCIMCIGAIAVAGIGEVIFGAADPVRGGADGLARVPYVGRTIKSYQGGVLAEECAALFAAWVRPG